MSAMNAPDPEQFSGSTKVRLLRRRGKPRVPLRQRMRSEQLRRGVYLIPSLFTAGNLMCGFFSIIATFHGEYVNAALLILLANVFDGVDGMNFITQCVASSKENGAWKTLKHAACRA